PTPSRSSPLPYTTLFRSIRDHSLLRQESYRVLDLGDIFFCVDGKVTGVKFPDAILQTIADGEHQWMKIEALAVEYPEIVRIIKVYRFDDHGNRTSAAVGENIDAV